MHLVRAVLAVPVLFSIAAVVHGLQLSGIQSCGTRQEHTASGGFAIGQGATERKAIYNAGDLARQQVSNQTPSCASCPGTYEPCDGPVYYTWDNYTVGDPVWDPVLKAYLVSVTWECCDVDQTCEMCP